MMKDIEEQFKDELTRFKKEINGHKDDFRKVIKELTDEGKKTVDLQKSIKLRALKA